jgi:hypothetical protein
MTAATPTAATKFIICGLDKSTILIYSWLSHLIAVT